jgi:hypothetical protein
VIGEEGEGGELIMRTMTTHAGGSGAAAGDLGKRERGEPRGREKKSGVVGEMNRESWTLTGGPHQGRRRLGNRPAHTRTERAGGGRRGREKAMARPRARGVLARPQGEGEGREGGNGFFPF